MNIISGLFEHCVLQRGNVISVTGTAAGNKVVAVVTKGQRRIAQAGVPIRRQQFTLRFRRLPAGGPYTVTLTAGAERLVVNDVLVGDVWICAGQSNMQGLGYLQHAEKPNPQVRAFYMDDHWAIARDPLHTYGNCVDDIHRLLAGDKRWPKPLEGVGPALSFALEMRRRTGVPQGLIPCAHGGSSLDQWSANLKSPSLYAATMRRVAKNGGRVAGIIWSQGESEGWSAALGQTYPGKMVELVKAFRRDLRDPRLPVVMTQIARMLPSRSFSPPWNLLQDQQRRLPLTIRQLAVVPTVDLPFDDDAHVGGDGNARLGRRLAEAMHLLRGGKGARPQIVLRRVRVVPDPLSWWGGSHVIVEFSNVAGKLVSAGRPTGFTIGHPSSVFGVNLDGQRAIVRTSLPPVEVMTQSLYYGQGSDPYCNITDQAGRSLPAFVMPLGTSRVLTPFVKPRVSQVFPGAALPYPAESVLWRTKPFQTDFCDVHDEFTTGAQLIYLACDLHVTEPMKLVALLGYDGPVKLWVDGRELFHDPNGTNPGIIDAKCIRFDAAPGPHQVRVALGSNAGKAWGIYLRFQRLDGHLLPEVRP